MFLAATLLGTGIIVYVLRHAGTTAWEVEGIWETFWCHSALIIISGSSYALPHASRVIGEEITLNFERLLRFWSLNSSLQIPPIAARNVPASPESHTFRSHCSSSFSHGFWLGWMVIILVVVTSAIRLHIVSNTHVTANRWHILLQVHLVPIDCLSEDLPVSSLKTVLQHGNGCVQPQNDENSVWAYCVSAQDDEQQSAWWRYDQRSPGGGGLLLCMPPISLCTPGLVCYFLWLLWRHACKTKAECLSA